MDLVDALAEAVVTVEIAGLLFSFFAYVAHGMVKS